jgi:hypothetical protein
MEERAFRRNFYWFIVLVLPLVFILGVQYVYPSRQFDLFGI